MTIPLKKWMRGERPHAADLNRMVEAIRRATPVAGKGISVSQSLGGSVISLTGNATGTGGGAPEGGDFPFMIRRVNSGTLENPAWHTVVYVPENAINVTIWAGVTYIRDADSTKEYTGMPGWYEYARNDGFGVVVLQLALYLDYRAEPQTYKCYWRLAMQGDSVAAWNPQAAGQYARGKFEVPLGEVTGSGAGEVYNLVRSSVYVARVNFYSPGGGGGTTVVVTDERGTSTAPGIIGYGGSADGVVSLIVKKGVAVDAVYMDADATVRLLDYLAGDAEEQGMGTNLNTDNFPNECLGPALTPNADEGDPDLAAPSIHKHTLDQLEDEEGNAPFSDADSLISYFSNFGMWDSLGETGPSGEPPSEDSILTVGDILTDDVMLKDELKSDAAVSVAGDPSTDLLVLSGHRHPLNVADVAMATGPTGETPAPPPAEDYVLPVGVGTTGPSGEASPGTAAFGVQPFYARVDHIHPICEDMGPTGAGLPATAGPSGGIDGSMGDLAGDFGATGPTAPPSDVNLDSKGWTPGLYGYTESYCTRIVKGSDGYTKYAIFRRRAVSRTGAVLWVGPEYVGFSLAG